MIPVKIGEPSWRVLYPLHQNDMLMKEDLDFIDEVREGARIKEMAKK